MAQYMPSMKEKARKMFSPQCLINNPITDLNMAQYMPSVKENKRKVFSPQCLLNNPITDLEHSQYVQIYIQEMIDKEERTKEKECLINRTSAGNDLHLPAQVLANNELEYEVIDLSNNERRETIAEDYIHINRQLYQKHEKKRDDYSEPPCKIEEDKRYERYQLDKKHKIEHEYSEPPRKPPKLLRLERQYSGLVEKIHADCLMATVEDIHGNYPLHNAVMQNNLKLVIRYSLVLTAMNNTLDLINNQGMTPLLLAVYHRQPSIVSYLVRMGANQAMTTMTGNTSYHLAVERRDLRTLRELLKRCSRKEDLNLLNDKGLTALHLAVIEKDESMVQSLLASGAKPELQDARNGKTTLCLAVEKGCHKVVDLLALYGAGSSPVSGRGQNHGQTGAREDFLDHFTLNDIL